MGKKYKSSLDFITLSFTKGFDAIALINRAIWSAPPPVPAGMTNSTGLVGSHGWAAAGGTGTTVIDTVMKLNTARRKDTIVLLVS